MKKLLLCASLMAGATSTQAAFLSRFAKPARRVLKKSLKKRKKGFKTKLNLKSFFISAKSCFSKAVPYIVGVSVIVLSFFYAIPAAFLGIGYFLYSCWNSLPTFKQAIEWVVDKGFQEPVNLVKNGLEHLGVPEGAAGPAAYAVVVLTYIAIIYSIYGLIKVYTQKSREQTDITQNIKGKLKEGIAERKPLREQQNGFKKMALASLCFLATMCLSAQAFKPQSSRPCVDGSIDDAQELLDLQRRTSALNNSVAAIKSSKQRQVELQLAKKPAKKAAAVRTDDNLDKINQAIHDRNVVHLLETQNGNCERLRLAISRCAINGWFEGLEVLKDLIENISTLRDSTVLNADAAEGGNIKIIDLLLRSCKMREGCLFTHEGRYKGYTILHIAAYHGNPEAVRYYIDKCKLKCDESVRKAAHDGGNQKLAGFIFDEYLTNFAQTSRLIMAGDIAEVKKVSRFDVSHEGETAAQCAVRAGKMDILKYLLEKYPDMAAAKTVRGQNLGNFVIYGNGKEGNNKDILKYLLEKYPDMVRQSLIWSLEGGYSADLPRFEKNQKGILRNFMSHGAKLADAAASAGKIRTLEYLHTQYADCFKNSRVLHICAEYGHVETLDHLATKYNLKVDEEVYKAALSGSNRNGMCRHLESKYLSSEVAKKVRSQIINGNDKQ